jgi:hypothetical protein
MLPSTSIYIFSCCEVGFVSNDTLVIIGVEGVIHPLMSRKVAGDPVLMGEALAGISFSTGLSSYQKHSTARAGMSVWCADETVALMRGMLSADSLVDVAVCTYPNERVEEVFEALELPEPTVHIPAEHDAARDDETWFMAQKTAPILNYLRGKTYDRLIWVDAELNRVYTQQYQVLYDAVSELVLVAPEPENGLNKVEIALLHELCGTEGNNG